MDIPLFPLHLVLFPGRPLPLHLFEPRYRRMLADCMADSGQFGVVAIREGREAGGGADTYAVGCIARIEQVCELPDGRFDIATRGTRRFHIEEPIVGHPYAAARVSLRPDEPPGPSDMDIAPRLTALLRPYLADLGAPDELLERLPEDPAELAHLAAATLQVDLAEQQRLLELDDVGARLRAAMILLRRETGLVRHLGAVGSLRPPGPGGADLN